MMKKLFLIAVVGGLLTTSCEKKAENTASESNNIENSEVSTETNATEVQEVAEIDAANAPVLSLENTNYDFGDVKANEKSSKTITFTNTGATPLQIKDAKSSCGCTVPKYSNEPIAPGESGELVVEFQANAMNGKQTKTVTLITNTVKSTETFSITANVVGGKEPQAPKAPVNQPVPNFN